MIYQNLQKGRKMWRDLSRLLCPYSPPAVKFKRLFLNLWLYWSTFHVLPNEFQRSSSSSQCGYFSMDSGLSLFHVVIRGEKACELLSVTCFMLSWKWILGSLREVDLVKNVKNDGRRAWLWKSQVLVRIYRSSEKIVSVTYVWAGWVSKGIVGRVKECLSWFCLT